MITEKFTIHPTKTTEQTVQFVVTLDVIHASLQGTPTYPRLTIEKQPDTWHAYLLRSDYTLPLAGTSLDHAGYEGNPGTITLRGKDLGEICIQGGQHRNTWLESRYSEPSPTQTTREFFAAQVFPVLEKFVADNMQALEAERKQNLAWSYASMFVTIEAETWKLKDAIRKALKALEIAELEEVKC